MATTMASSTDCAKAAIPRAGGRPPPGPPEPPSLIQLLPARHHSCAPAPGSARRRPNTMKTIMTPRAPAQHSASCRCPCSPATGAPRLERRPLPVAIQGGQSGCRAQLSHVLLPNMRVRAVGSAGGACDTLPSRRQVVDFNGGGGRPLPRSLRHGRRQGGPAGNTVGSSVEVDASPKHPPHCTARTYDCPAPWELRHTLSQAVGSGGMLPRA